MDPRERFYKDTTMFLVYGKLTSSTFDNPQASQTSGHSKKTTFKEPPIVSFFASPLVDYTGFTERLLLNTRSFDQFVQEAEESQISNSVLSDGSSETFVRYENPEVDSIMNGSESGYNSGNESDQTSPEDMEIDEDGSLHQEMEILRALERSKTWSPYTVLAPPAVPTTELNTPPSSTSKDRILSRSITGDGLPSSKDASMRSSSLSRHKSMDSFGKSSQAIPGNNSNTKIEVHSNITSSSSVIRPSKKGISRMKSPSRAPQQPLDITTESLRRKLLGTSSVRGEQSSSSKQTATSSSSNSTSKSIEASNKSYVKNLTTSALAKINISKEHEDYKECVKNLYRSVTFAMRKDIATKKYSLEELEQLMDKHAGLL
ncbi:hypothetical protein BGZ76_009116 [Entomortierella beljakovae]|nr:hypothetical protein BGZ76_009116 [Entomortierella beljakovae]